VATEPNKPIVLRTVKRGPVLAPQDVSTPGIIFECAAETKCPHCNAVVSLAGAQPLSSLPCPSCGGKVFVAARVGGFFLHEHIGEGEMGAIYKATDESLNREVAVKLVRGCHADDPGSRERLLREACAAGKLNHPRVAQVYALNFSNGYPYLVMELVTGQDFAQKLEREGRVDERTVLRMALDVADGLSALNRERLVHGDIKPGNIVLDRDGNAKLVDFGLSGMTRLDSNGNFVGTPNYIAPELLRGLPDTHRSDLYSLGATLYHLLSGRLTHDGETPTEILKAKLWKQPVAIGKCARHVSSLTQRLVMRMLDPDPEKRQLNSDAVAAEIRASIARLDVPPAAAPGAAVRIRRFVERLRLPRRLRPVAAPSRSISWVVVIVLGLIAVAEFLIAARIQSNDQAWAWLRQRIAGKEQPFGQTWERFRRSVAGKEQFFGQAWARLRRDVAHKKDDTSSASRSPQTSSQKPKAGALGRDLLSTEDNRIWESMNLGVNAQRGSTMYMGGTMIIQGPGTDMWKGYDRCRFVWSKASGDYEFSSQVNVIADKDGFAVTGLLVKGADPTVGPGLLFGFLGNGELFLQLRHPNNSTVVVKRSGRRIELPHCLKIVRRGKTFEASLSVDGVAWDRFASCELDLPADNAVGFSVSAQIPDTLATAKFARIRLVAPLLPAAAAQTNGVSAAAAPQAQ